MANHHLEPAYCIRGSLVSFLDHFHPVSSFHLFTYHHILCFIIMGLFPLRVAEIMFSDISLPGQFLFVKMVLTLLLPERHLQYDATRWHLCAEKAAENIRVARLCKFILSCTTDISIYLGLAIAMYTWASSYRMCYFIQVGFKLHTFGYLLPSVLG